MELQTMVAQLKEQAAQIQKVSTQLEMSKPAAKVVNNYQTGFQTISRQASPHGGFLFQAR